MVALQNVKDPKSWLRIRDSKLEGNVSSLDSEHNYDVGGVIVCMAGWMGGGLCALFRVKVGVSASLEWRKTVRKNNLGTIEFENPSVYTPLTLDGHVTLESVAAPGNYVGIDSEGGITGPTETDPSSESAHFKPNVKVASLSVGKLGFCQIPVVCVEL